MHLANAIRTLALARPRVGSGSMPVASVGRSPHAISVVWSSEMRATCSCCDTSTNQPYTTPMGPWVGSDTAAEPGIASGSKANIYSFPVAAASANAAPHFAPAVAGQEDGRCQTLTGGPSSLWLEPLFFGRSSLCADVLRQACAFAACAFAGCAALYK